MAALIEMDSPSVALDAEEASELARLEEVVADGLRGWFQAGMALKEIRDRRLYKGTHSRFTDYALEKWGLDKSTAYQRMWACEVVVELGCPQETSQFALDMLYPLGDDKKRVWDECVRRAKGQPVTSTIIRSVCSTLDLAPPNRGNTGFRWPTWLKASHVAMDADGNWSAFESRPALNRSAGCWQSDGDETWLFSSLIKWTPPKCNDWTQSLISRPASSGDD